MKLILTDIKSVLEDLEELRKGIVSINLVHHVAEYHAKNNAYIFLGQSMLTQS